MFLIIELIGTAAFACSGAMVAIKKDLDFLGIVVLGVTTAVGGGMLRDILLGNTPPRLFFNTIYPLTAFLAVLIMFIVLKSRRFTLDVFRSNKFDFVLNGVDAVGLGVFTATGTDTVIAAGYGEQHFLMIFLGIVTGVGGGLLRDVLVGQTPYIFRKHFYACASLLGAVTYTRMLHWEYERLTALIVSTVFVVIIRVLARHYCWGLPKTACEEIL